MNIKKLLKKADSYLSADKRKRKEKREYLKRVVGKLKKHEKALVKRLETEDDKSERDRIKKEIALAHAQRKKGLKNLKALKKS